MCVNCVRVFVFFLLLYKPKQTNKKIWQISDRYRSSASDQDVDDQTLLTFFDGFRSTSPTPPPFLSPWFNTVTMHMSRVSQARSVLGSSGTHVRGGSEFLDQIWFFFFFLSFYFYQFFFSSLRSLKVSSESGLVWSVVARDDLTHMQLVGVCPHPLNRYRKDWISCASWNGSDSLGFKSLIFCFGCRTLLISLVLSSGN